MKDRVRGVVRHLGAPLQPEVDRVRHDAKGLSTTDVYALAAGSILVVVLTIMGRLMYFTKYATLDAADFHTYHSTHPVIVLVSSVLFMIIVYLKGVRYYLVYVIPFTTAVGSVVLLMLIHGHLDPKDLAVFDFGPKWWRG